MKGVVSKIETLRDGSIKVSVSMAREAGTSVFGLQGKEVYLETESVEVPVDNLTKVGDILRKALRLLEECDAIEEEILIEKGNKGN